jgi:hypothetical protein
MISPFVACCLSVSSTMGLMQISVQFPGISVTILDVLYVVYIIIIIILLLKLYLHTVFSSGFNMQQTKLNQLQK